MKPNVKKIAVATLSAIALTTQIAAIPQTAAKAEDCSTESEYAQIVVAAEGCAMSEYEKSQIELLMIQLIAEEKGSVAYYDISYEYENLYGAQNEGAGYVVDFSYQGDVGYIIAFTNEYAVAPAEMVYGYNSPYYGKKGTYLYPSTGNYFIMSDNGEISVAVEVNQPQGVKKSGFIGEEKNITINYGNYSRLEVNDNYFIPDVWYNYGTGLDDTHTNNCANAAGVIILNYWNKHFNNKLLKLSNDEMLQAYWAGHMNDTAATKYMKIFYDYMNTNWIYGEYGGTLPSDCYNGFMRLIREHGYQAVMVELDDYDMMRIWIQMGVPVFLTHLSYAFSNVSDVCDITSDDQSGTLTFNAKLYKGISKFHTFVGYGYVDFTIYDQEGNPQYINLIKVADGWNGAQYLHINCYAPYSAAAINVYKPLSGC